MSSGQHTSFLGVTIYEVSGSVPHRVNVKNSTVYRKPDHKHLGVRVSEVPWSNSLRPLNVKLYNFKNIFSLLKKHIYLRSSCVVVPNSGSV